MTIGEAIRAIRHSVGETQQQMADVLDITNVYLSCVETGQKTPSLKMIERVSHYYGFDPYVLMALTSHRINVTAHLEFLKRY